MPLNKVDMAFVVRQMCYMLLYANLRLIEITQVGTNLRKEKIVFQLGWATLQRVKQIYLTNVRHTCFVFALPPLFRHLQQLQTSLLYYSPKKTRRAERLLGIEKMAVFFSKLSASML